MASLPSSAPAPDAQPPTAAAAAAVAAAAARHRIGAASAAVQALASASAVAAALSVDTSLVLPILPVLPKPAAPPPSQPPPPPLSQPQPPQQPQHLHHHPHGSAAIASTAFPPPPLHDVQLAAMRFARAAALGVDSIPSMFQFWVEESRFPLAASHLRHSAAARGRPTAADAASALAGSQAASASLPKPLMPASDEHNTALDLSAVVTSASSNPASPATGDAPGAAEAAATKHEHKWTSPPALLSPREWRQRQLAALDRLDRLYSKYAAHVATLYAHEAELHRAVATCPSDKLLANKAWSAQHRHGLTAGPGGFLHRRRIRLLALARAKGRAASASLKSGGLPTCSFVDSEGAGCTKFQLPYTTVCWQHLLQEPRQTLFVACKYVSSDGFRCTEPVERGLVPALCANHIRISDVAPLRQFARDIASPMQFDLDEDNDNVLDSPVGPDSAALIDGNRPQNAIGGDSPSATVIATASASHSEAAVPSIARAHPGGASSGELAADVPMIAQHSGHALPDVSRPLTVPSSARSKLSSGSATTDAIANASAAASSRTEGQQGDAANSGSTLATATGGLPTDASVSSMDVRADDLLDMSAADLRLLASQASDLLESL
jgi:hypothetical protein